jgi:predicted helicase
MTSSDRDSLQGIKRFDQLVKYLRDKLDWPIDGESFDDLTFDYEPEELGIDMKTAAKIQEIKQLRPLISSQPWGIFFVKFEPKRLPVVALRRLLSQLVIKRRASSRKAEQPAWHLHDLLFISNYGEGEQRQITFAHFSEGKDGDLPTLKVLGWDDSDTALHIDHVHQTLKDKLHWPRDEDNLTEWHTRWSSAFTLEHREVIETSKEMSFVLAELARRIRKRANAVLKIETDRGVLRKLHKAFKEALIHDLSEDGFADMYAQTIAYGLLSARITNPKANTADSFAVQIPVTNPFLKELMESFLHIGGRKIKAGRGLGIDFDELGVSEIVDLLDHANMEAVVRDFGDRNPQEDPIIHFYEDFVKQYDKSLWRGRGVIYTPRPVVSYIVRSVHELLQIEFGLADGLADTATWGEMAKRYRDLTIPEGVKPTDRFVTILDIATGTGTFLVEVIDVIYRTVVDKWKREGHSKKNMLDLWNDYVPTHLLPRLHGYELLMAPYAIAHLKIGLKLHETGYRFESNERVRIYLTNSLEPVQDFSGKFEFMIPALAHEAEAVNHVKRHQRFTVAIGNPPYAGISSNMSEEIMNLVEPYKSINGVSLGERKIWAQDDYKKFIRFTQLRISETGCGVIGLITNHGFINEPTSRGMRHNLQGTFSRISVLDLHGSLKKREICPNLSPDKNVFDIEPGVAISFLRLGGAAPDGVTHGEIWGLREHKYDYLLSHTLSETRCSTVSPTAEFYLFIPQNEDTKVEFSMFLNVTDIFESGSNGIQTSRDHVVYGFSESECRAIIEEFFSSEKTISTKDLRMKYWSAKKVASYAPGDTRGWQVPDARDQLRRDRDWESRFKRALYRPFDFRKLFYSDYMIDWPRTDVMSQMLRPNLSLCVGRAGNAADNQEWNIVFVANTLVDMNLFYRGGNVNYPLRFASLSHTLDFDRKPRPNFKSTFLKALNIAFGSQKKGDFDLPQNLTPEDIFHYIYAVFHSPGYRSRYAEFLKIDFPRLPLTSSLDLFRALTKVGGELVALHLMESPKLDEHITRWIGGKNPEVEKVAYSDETVWTNKAQTEGFCGVPEPVWNFHIGGYQVCEKWLKDRKGRTFSKDDIAHYQKIVVALSETIRLMVKIDKIIEEHGGWPNAFTNA